MSWWQNDMRVYLSRALWPSLAANTVGTGTIVGVGVGAPACGISCTENVRYGTTTVLTATFLFHAELADASLSDLALSAGTLTPAFVSTTTSYIASVANDVSSVTLTPTMNYTDATYTVTNAAGVCAVDACALNEGANTITVTVVAAAGETISISVRTASQVVSLDAAFRYEESSGGMVDAAVGGVVTTTNGVMLTIPALPVSGTLQVTLVPVAPPTTTSGSVLLYSFALSATLDGEPLASFTSGIQLEFVVDGAPTAAGEQPWAFEQQPDVIWQLVSAQKYSASTGRLTTRAQKQTNYAVTLAQYYQQRFPQVRR